MDLDDLLDEMAPETKKPTSTIAQKKKSAVTRFGVNDDLDDSFDNLLGGGGPKVAKQQTGSFGVGTKSATNAKPPKRFDDDQDNDDSFFGVGSAVRKPQNPTMARNDSFGGGSRNGSAAGSRKSKAEIEAEEFDMLCADITGPEPDTSNVNRHNDGGHVPTGTFRNSENDGWEDLNFGGRDTGRGGYGGSKP